MLLRLPPEILCEIAESCSRSGQASLALTCRRLYGICNRILYRADVLHGGSRAVFYAITRYKDHNLITSTLDMSLSAGADLEGPLSCLGAAPLACAETRSPIHLAASRGQDAVVTFLLKHGVSPNGPSELTTTAISPFLAALLARQEQTALLLMRSGASACVMSGLNCMHIAVEAGLQQLVEYLVVERKIDVNSRSASGKTSIMLAIIWAKSDAQLAQLVRLGADVQEALRQACHALSYEGATRLLDVGGSRLQEVMSLKHVADLLILVSTQRNRSTYRQGLIERLLAVGGRIAADPPSGLPDISPQDFQTILSGLLQRVLSLEHSTDIALASLLLDHGAPISAGTVILVGAALRSFCINKCGAVSAYPGLLKVFQVVHDNLVTICLESRSSLALYFLKQMPREAVAFLQELVENNLPLDIYGVKMLLDMPLVQ